jgi:hypothetical protein
MPSASEPIVWRPKSESGWRVALLIAGSKLDSAVLKVGVWQFTHSIWTKSC